MSPFFSNKYTQIYAAPLPRPWVVPGNNASDMKR